MALPDDSYPLATQSGQQIRLDMIRPKLLDHIPFLTASGSAVIATPIEVNGVYILSTDADCIVDFVGVATKLPVATVAVLVCVGSPVTITLPSTATGFSAIGVAANGTLYIQRVIPWAGLANTTSGEVS